MNDYSGKTALVTGAATGIGRALCLELASRGAEVFVTALTVQEAQQVVDEITASGGVAHAAKCDVCESEDIKSAIHLVVQNSGKLDLMINNAGLLHIGEFADMDERFLEKICRVNFTAVCIGSFHALGQMKKQGFGHIFNIASMAGLLGSPGMAAYSATKHGVVGLSKSLLAEAKPYGIKVQVGCLSNVESKLIDNAECESGHNEVYRKLFPKAQKADAAARVLLDKMLGKSLFLYTPFHARIMAWLYRLSPGLMQAGSSRLMQEYRSGVK